MIFLLLLSFIIPFFIGFFIINGFWFRQESILSGFALKFILSIGTGVGVSSLVFFMSLFLFTPSRNMVIVFDFVLLLLSLVFYVFSIKLRRRMPCSEIQIDTVYSNTTIMKLVSLLLCLVIGLFMVAFSLRSIIKDPHGYIDAVGFFNLMARVLFRGGEDWVNFYTLIKWNGLGLSKLEYMDMVFPQLLHHSYPLLLPGFIARTWYYISEDTTTVPIIITLMFTFLTIGLLYTSLSILRGKSQGLLATLLIVGSPIYFQCGINQVADVPISFYYLSTIILFALNDRFFEKNKSLIVLAGLTAGLSAWTKNEGLMFVILIFVASAIVYIPVKGLKFYIKELLPFTIGLLPVLLVIIYFKIYLVESSYVFAHGSGSIIDKLIDPSRFLMVSKVFLKNLFIYNTGAIFVLFVYYILLGSNVVIKQNVVISTFLIVFILYVTGLFAIYLISPLDPTKMITGSLKRLVTHLWPSVIFIFFLIVNTPEESDSTSKNKRLISC